MEIQKLNEALRRGADCLPLDELGRFADGALAGPERDRASAHVGGCLNCQAEFALLQAFATTAITDDEAAVVEAGVRRLRAESRRAVWAAPVEESRRSGWVSLWGFRPAAALAVVLLLVGGGYYLVAPTAPGIPGGATDTAPDVMRSLSIALLGPIGDLVAAPQRFEWAAVPGAASYRIRLTEVDRTEAWAADSTTAGADIPANVRAGIVPGKTLLWEVTAVDAAGATIAASDVLSFRLTTNAPRF